MWHWIRLCIQGHSSFITHLDWSKDGKYIMSNSGDYEILYCEWTRVASRVLPEAQSNPTVTVFPQGTLQEAVNCWGIALRAKTESGPLTPVCWASTSWVRKGLWSSNVYLIKNLSWRCCCVATGVWLEGSDGTDINALCRSHSERMVAVADDFCKVHLFQYPCPKPKVMLTYVVLVFKCQFHCGGWSRVDSKLSRFRRHQATSMTAMAATSPTSASRTAIPTCSQWAGRTPASFSGGWWEAARVRPGTGWPPSHPPPPVLQNRLPPRRDLWGLCVTVDTKQQSVYVQRESEGCVSQWTGATTMVPLLPQFHIEHGQESFPHLHKPVHPRETEHYDLVPTTAYFSFTEYVVGLEERNWTWLDPEHSSFLNIKFFLLNKKLPKCCLVAVMPLKTCSCPVLIIV